RDMAHEHILRLPWTDREGESILVKVSPYGKKALDLSLVASESEHVYPATIKQANVKSLQASNYNGSLDEWKATLRYALLHEQPAISGLDGMSAVEAVATIKGNTLTITLRKNTGGIRQRLGSIELKQDDEQEIDLFTWASTAAAATDGLRQQNSELRTDAGSQEERIAKLSRQLDDLIKAKKDHEDELLKKFAALLNAKKLKIRDQQRLLASAKVDPQAAAAIHNSRSGDSRTREAGGSRKGKRKANGGEDLDLDAVDVSDERAAAENGANDDDDDDQEEQQTPQQTEDEVTEDEEEAGFDAAPAPPLTQGRASSGSSRPPTDPGPPPPRRELPFAAKSAPSGAKKPLPDPAPAEVEEDETDDDEL
ncbi:hypothetical protein LTR53_017285, partial [Teratosphaeriaceae sp. CCFEE 6253]